VLSANSIAREPALNFVDSRLDIVGQDLQFRPVRVAGASGKFSEPGRLAAKQHKIAGILRWMDRH
jgi:hypothetical protein